jgi:hypothetical protein
LRSEFKIDDKFGFDALRDDEPRIRKIIFFHLCSNLLRRKVVTAPSVRRPFPKDLLRLWRCHHNRNVKQAGKIRPTRTLEKKAVTLGDYIAYG